MKFDSLEEEVVLQKQLEKMLILRAEKENLSLRTSVSVSPTTATTNMEMKLNLGHSLSYKQFLVECICSWYFPEDTRVLYQVLLEEKKFRYGLSKVTEIELLLSSKVQMLNFILHSSVLGRNSCELFGFIKQQKLLQPKIVYRENRDQRVFQEPNRSRVRGYRDKGSLGKNSISSTEVSHDYQMVLKQQQLEEERQLQKDTSEFLRGFLI